MRNYQPRKNNKYYLRPGIFKKTLAIVRDYPELWEEEKRKEISEQGKRELLAIMQAREALPEEYGEAIFRNLVYGAGTSYMAADTRRRWRARFLYEVASRLLML